MKLSDLPRPLALVLTGGTARAASQVGMLRALTEHDIKPDLIVATSTGAINGAVAAADPHFIAEQLEPLWVELAADPLLTSIWRTAVKGVSRRQTLRTQTALRTHLSGLLGDVTFEQLPVPLTLTATDLNSGRPISLESGSVVEALLASCAFPVLLPPIETETTLLVDGSVTSAAPVSQAAARGAASIILLDTGASSVPEQDVEDARWYSVMGYAFEHLIRGQAAHDLAEVASAIPVAIIPFNGGSPFDLKAASSLIKPGYDAAETAIHDLASAPGSKRSVRPGLYGATGALARDERLLPLLR